MQEFWFCSSCKSMNRADSNRCYKCRAVKEQATLATVAERSPGVVLTPGLDDDNREIAWALMSGRRYVSAWRLGYVSATLIFVFLALAALFIPLVFIVAISLPERGIAAVDADSTRNAVTAAVGLALVLVGLAMVVLHSIFLGLTSMNAPALGCGTPRFGAVRAGLWWIESYLWTLWGVQTLWLLPYIVARAFGILCGPIAAIGKPRRLLQDLMDRLGVPGSSDSRLVGFWSMAWGAARGINYATYLGPLVVLIAFLFLFISASRMGVALTPAPEGQVRVFSIILVVLIVVGELVAEGAALFLLARVTMEMSQRQRVREGWVLNGPTAVGAGVPAYPPSGAPAAETSFARAGDSAPQYGFKPGQGPAPLDSPAPRYGFKPEPDLPPRYGYSTERDSPPRYGPEPEPAFPPRYGYVSRPAVSLGRRPDPPVAASVPETVEPGPAAEPGIDDVDIGEGI
jgi:hypothetical protein